jgi:undecaprenyl-diphosphatase
LTLAFTRTFGSKHRVPDWLAILILGIIEGITEFLPVSSTGHLLLAGRWLAPQSNLFYIVIQSGAVLAVIPLFSRRLRSLWFQWRDPQVKDYFLKLAAAFLITAVGGFLLKLGGLTLDDEPLPIVIALIAGGLLFLGVERWLQSRPQHDRVTWSIALAVGLGQLIAAVFPGASRSGTTILLALALGLRRPAATEFTFLTGIPTMLAAGGYEILRELQRPDTDGAGEDWGMLVLGTVVSAVVSFLAVRWLLTYVQRHTFVIFGYYRILFGAALLLLL